MAQSGNQTETGKAFEFACAQAIFESQTRNLAVEIADSPQLETAKRCFAYLQAWEKENYKRGANAAIRIIDRLEPRLYSGNGQLTISLQADSKGISGDVRDVLCIRGTDWEIGLSCKHNHEAVKHSRLSDSIDFGKEWFGLRCSDTYFEEIGAIFHPLRKLRDSSNKTALWSDIPDKDSTCYIPALKAFIKELNRLDKEHPGMIPERLIRYLVGRNDFYKVIMNEKRKVTQIDAININGTLNKPAGSKKALVDVPVLKLPTKFYEVEFKDGSSNTINVICNQGWNVSMRIHNASSKVEPSLKFDVQLLATPSSILRQYEPW